MIPFCSKGVDGKDPVSVWLLLVFSLRVKHLRLRLWVSGRGVVWCGRGGPAGRLGVRWMEASLVCLVKSLAQCLESREIFTEMFKAVNV